MAFSLSIDDCGTGYSSLSYLKRFLIDTIKIDHAFVKNLASETDQAVITIAMAHGLKLCVVAEGVEMQPRLNMLSDRWCGAIRDTSSVIPYQPIASSNYFESVVRRLTLHRRAEYRALINFCFGTWHERLVFRSRAR